MIPWVWTSGLNSVAPRSMYSPLYYKAFNLRPTSVLVPYPVARLSKHAVAFIHLVCVISSGGSHRCV